VTNATPLVSAHSTGCTRFASVADAIALLMSPPGGKVLPEVPRGPKCNASFVVDNKSNVERHAAGQKNQFWDDCGVWNSTDGRTVTSTYMTTGKSVAVVKCVDGQYCTQRVIEKRRHWVLLSVQPASKEIVTFNSYYTVLKADRSYRKRVSWLSKKPEVALYEYQGSPPSINQPHGLQRHAATEFLRTKPKVLDEIRHGIQQKNAKPRGVYEALTLANTSDDRPRDHKQVRNVGQNVNVQQGKHPGANVADDMQALLASVQTHEFVRAAWTFSGDSGIH